MKCFSFFVSFFLAFCLNAQRLDSLINEAKHHIATDLVKASITAQRALSVAKVQGDASTEAAALRILGDIRFLLGDYSESLEHYMQSVSHFKALNDSTSISDGLSKIGLVYKNTREYSQALDMFKEARQFAPHQDTIAIAHLLNNRGIVHNRLNNFEKAEELFNKALFLKKKIGDSKGISNTYTNLGILKAKNNDLNLALTYFEQSLKIEEAIGSLEGQAKSLNNIGELYLMFPNTALAIEFANRGLELAEGLDTKMQISHAAGTLAQAHEINGDFKLAHQFYKQSVAAERSHFSESELKKLGRLESKLELIKQQNKIELLEAKNIQSEQQKFFMVVIALSLAFASTYVVFNQRQKSKLKEQLLHIQIAELKDKVLLSFSNPVEIPPLSSLNEHLHHPISDREYEVLENIILQKSNKEISDNLYISINTVKYHVKNLYIKLGVSNRKEVLEKIAIH